MNRAVEAAILGLQVFHVIFLLLHDWVPLGRWNDLQAVHSTDSLSKRVRVTLYSALPFVLVLVFCCVYARAPRFPGWVVIWLWWSYGLLFAGELWAWWVPYLLRPDPVRAARYRVLFGNTHTLLPQRNGFSPNTLHLLLHVATLSLLLLLASL